MTPRGQGRSGAVCGVALALACATPKSNTPGARSQEPIQSIQIEDALHGVRYELPPAEGGWQSAREGSAEIGEGVQVEVAGFPMPTRATPITCREHARARLAQGRTQHSDTALLEVPARDDEPGEGLRDQMVGDAPVPSWSFTRGEAASAVRSRWGFYARGDDCVLLEVTGPRGASFVDKVFALASRTLELTPLSLERQREIDLLAGMGFLERRNPGAALDRFEALSSREPRFAKAHFGALMAAFELGPPAYARGLLHGEAVLEAERELSPEQRQLALRAMGVIQLSQDRLQGAARTLAELVVRVPDLAEGQYNYACALARLGNTDGALDHLRTAVRLDENLASHARTDEDLKALRGMPAFQTLVEGEGPR